MAPKQVSMVPAFELSNESYAKRTSDRQLWPLPNKQAIGSHKSIAELMISGYVSHLLAVNGIIPVVVSLHPKEKNQTVVVPFGPMLDGNHQPCQPGDLHKASRIYNQYHLKKTVEYHDTWSRNIWMANAIVI
jgi:hypothetical protein